MAAPQSPPFLWICIPCCHFNPPTLTRPISCLSVFRCDHPFVRSQGEVAELRAAALTAAKERSALQQILDSKVRVMLLEIINEVRAGGWTERAGGEKRRGWQGVCVQDELPWRVWGTVDESWYEPPFSLWWRDADDDNAWSVWAMAVKSLEEGAFSRGDSFFFSLSTSARMVACTAPKLCWAVAMQHVYAVKAEGQPRFRSHELRWLSGIPASVPFSFTVCKVVKDVVW